MRLGGANARTLLASTAILAAGSGLAAAGAQGRTVSGSVSDPQDAALVGGDRGPDLRQVSVTWDADHGTLAVDVVLQDDFQNTGGVFDTFRMTLGDTWSAAAPSCAATGAEGTMRLVGSIDPTIDDPPTAAIGPSGTLTGTRTMAGPSHTHLTYTFHAPALVGRPFACASGPALVRSDPSAVCDPADPTCDGLPPRSDVGDTADPFPLLAPQESPSGTGTPDDPTAPGGPAGPGAPPVTTPTTAVHRMTVTRQGCAIRVVYTTGPAAATNYNKVLVRIHQRSGGRYAAARAAGVRATPSGPLSTATFTGLRAGRYDVSAVYLGDRLRIRPPALRRSVQVPAACRAPAGSR